MHWLFTVTIVTLSVACLVVGGMLWKCLSKATPESFTERPRVVVSFTTIPGRVKYISDVADELSKQTFQPDAIYACIPTESKRFKENYEVDPSKIPPEITVVRCQDYGPATKLLGCLEYETDPATIIITVDDDRKYPKDLLESLVKAGLKHPNLRVGTFARHSDFDRNPLKIVGVRREETGDHLGLLGFGGILYRRGMITPEVMAYFYRLSPSDSCWKSDDVTFDRLLTKNGVKKRKIRGKSTPAKNSVDSVNPLSKESRTSTYNQCLANLEEYMAKK